MKKKLSTILLLILVVVLCFSLTACNEKQFGEELLNNGSFDAVNALEGWKSDVPGGKGYSESTSEDGSGKFISINNTTNITSNLYQNVKLEKGATYLISAKIRIDKNLSNNNGFSIGFIENSDFNPIKIKITNGWEDYKFYFKSDLANVNLAIRLNGQGGVNIDNVSLVKVDPSTLADTTDIFNLTTGEKLPYHKSVNGIVFAVLMTLLTFVILALMYYFLKRVAVSDNFLPAKESQKITIFKSFSLSPIGISAILMLVGFVLRFILATTVYGYDPMYYNEAVLINKMGLSAYYFTNNSITTPGYLYYLTLFGLIQNSANITGVMGISIMLKLPSIIADIAVIYLIYTFGRKYVGDKNAGLFSLLYAILPPIFVLNGGWGGTESLAVLGFVAIAICMVEKKHIGLFFSCLYAILFSMETVYVLPIVFGYLVFQSVKDKKFIAKAVVGVISFFVAFYFLTLQLSIFFAKNNLPMIIFTRYYDVLGAHATACINNFSIYALMGLNNIDASKGTFIISIIFVVMIWAFAIYCYVASKNRLNLIMLSAFTLLATSSFAVNQTTVPAVAGVALLLLYAMISRDRRIYYLLTGYATLNAMNLFTIIDISGLFTEAFNRYELFKAFDWAQILGSVVMIILDIVFMFVAFDICIDGRRKEIQPLYDSDIDEAKSSFSSKNKKAISK